MYRGNENHIICGLTYDHVNGMCAAVNCFFIWVSLTVEIKDIVLLDSLWIFDKHIRALHS